MKSHLAPKTDWINISEFKAKALQLIAETAQKGKEHVITKKGVPVARVVPFKTRTGSRQDSLKGLIEVKEDLVNLNFSSHWDVLK